MQDPADLRLIAMHRLGLTQMDLTVLPQDVKNVVEFKQQLMLNIKNEEVEIN